MSEEYRQSIYARLNEQETDELVAIWQENHRYEWSDTAFEVLRDILLERLGELPPQDEPLYEEPEEEPTEEFRQQIYTHLNEKETGELVAIWQANHRYEWSNTAFHIIRDILTERLGSLPPQAEPVFEENEQPFEESSDVEAVTERDLVFLDEENQPVCYRPSQVLRLEKWLDLAVKFAIPILILSALIQLPNMRMIFWSYNPNSELLRILSWLAGFVLAMIQMLINLVMFYLPLKVLAAILKILMQMEFNSRPPKASTDTPAQP